MIFRPRIVPLGDSAALVRLGDEIDPVTNRRVQALAALIAGSPLDGVIESIPAFATLLIQYDPLRLTYRGVRDWVRSKIDQVDAATQREPRLIEVPLQYGGEYGIDLEWVAQYHRLQVEDVIRIHCGKKYSVYMVGFTPGFPYMGKLEEAIAVPRLETPRTLVPAGTVAIAGLQTGIYPIDSPGGWRLIGYTPLQLFNLQSDVPFLFSPGDAVRFLPGEHVL